ncbi:uncharacterized protein CC84DRAFT_1205349 [Paraphaeosphaeria sporulosa]|uniref:Uncharacterized protein n=1 Tax=Paraphaeosphaeria sporulosa TaxID=1460663 RepID=A0A177CFL2_9PLEO|nr:uncharacterized protein CC84DRAFT_1205349 [Paraphaeosphaeria sporulosa]OAG05578.1 hypothetical protein CC84DRAFT_1205349 [Paraphaeosphaeria sporulosa]
MASSSKSSPSRDQPGSKLSLVTLDLFPSCTRRAPASSFSARTINMLLPEAFGSLVCLSSTPQFVTKFASASTTFLPVAHFSKPIFPSKSIPRTPAIMADFDPIDDGVDDAVENAAALANCWLTHLRDFDCSTTRGGVTEVLAEIISDDSDDLIDYDVVDKAECYTRMLEASSALRDWLKFEHHTKPLIDSGFSKLHLAVNVADFKDTAKKYK